MAERKFAALAGLKKERKPEAAAVQASMPVEIQPPIQPAKGRGRPPGKRSDPEFEPTTVLLRKATKRAAVRKLEDTDSKKDLSDLIEQLLAAWNERT